MSTEIGTLELGKTKKNSKLSIIFLKIIFSHADLAKKDIQVYLMSNDGKVCTPHFEDKFEMAMFDGSSTYSVRLKNPFEEIYDYNFNEYVFDEDIILEIDYDIHPEYECIYIDSVNDGCLNSTKNRYQTTLGKYAYKTIYFQRDFPNQDEIDKWKNKRFTGFRVNWYCSNCTGALDARNTYESYESNKLFVKIANLIHTGTPSDRIWNVIKSNIEDLKAARNNKYTDNDPFKVLLTNLKDNSFSFPENVYTETITDDTLNDAAEIYFYLHAPYQEYWNTLLLTYTGWLEILSLSRFLGLILKCIK